MRNAAPPVVRANPGKKGRDIDKIFDELRTKHITPTDLAKTRQVHVKTPDRLLRTIIDTLAKYVAKHGEEFEEAVRNDITKYRAECLRDIGLEEDSDVDFSWLEKGADSEEAIYYRWKTFTLAQGDTASSWRTEPFQMCLSGRVWHPPALREEDSSPSRSRSRSQGGRARSRSRSKEKDVKDVQWRRIHIMERNGLTNDSRSEERRRRKEMQRKTDAKAQAHGSGKLERHERKELSKLVGGLTSSVASIGRAMCWCLDKADCAVEVARHLLDAITEGAVDIEDRVLRLYLISDVVHNAKSTVATSAWCYRRELEAQLPETFEKFRQCLKAENSKLVTEGVTQQVSMVLRSWQATDIFTPAYIKGLETSFMKDVLPIEAVTPQMPGGQDAYQVISVKLSGWTVQHFSQLEKIARMRGLAWETVHLQSEDRGSLEDMKKKWLLDRLVTYEVHAWENRDVRSKDPELPAFLTSGRETPVISPAGLVLRGKLSPSVEWKIREDVDLSTIVGLEVRLLEDIDGEPCTKHEASGNVDDGYPTLRHPIPLLDPSFQRTSGKLVIASVRGTEAGKTAAAD
eukprot:TRINITY_DN112231_c0_g1_i1.p1 TRINITY_DN112231_c0_g1~~TRINITY_DN112231_c0_g1_i1.p1  ORF type:complete len:572 (+),score=93.62 TRINITY_DN112231_c0_g1_i1:144-1859(+)